MKFNCIMLKLVIDYSFTFKLFWPLIVNWQNRFSLSLCDESAGCGFRYFFPPPASYQNILMNFTRYRLRHLSFCRCVSGNMSTPISSTENTLLSLTHTHTPHPPCTHHRKETAMHTNKHVKFVERQAQNCIFSFLTRLRVRWARNKWDADRRLSHCLFALCPGQSYVYVCRGMGRHFDVCNLF